MWVTLTHIANGSSAHNAALRQAHHNEMGCWHLPRVFVYPYETFCEWIMVFKQIAMVKQTTKH